MGSYDLQRAAHAKNKDSVLRAVGGGNNRFGEICDASDLAKGTVSSILSELEKEELLAKDGAGRETRYSLTPSSFEALKLDTSAFRVVSEAYSRWHPSLVNLHEGANLVIGSYAFFPIIETGSLFDVLLDNRGMPSSPFIAAAETEGLVQAAIMVHLMDPQALQSMRNSTGRRGKHYMVVTVDFDEAYRYYEWANRLEAALVRGDTLSLFFLKYLNADPANDPIAAEIEKTGIPPFGSWPVDLDMREKNALIIAMSPFPILLKMMLSGKTPEEAQTLLSVVGKKIDGVFSDIIGVYEKAHGNFLHTWQNAEGSTLHNEAVTYLESMGVDRIGSTAIQEIQAILLLLYLKNGDISAAKVLLEIFGAPWYAASSKVKGALKANS